MGEESLEGVVVVDQCLQSSDAPKPKITLWSDSCQAAETLKAELIAGGYEIRSIFSGSPTPHVFLYGPNDSIANVFHGFNDIRRYLLA